MEPGGWTAVDILCLAGAKTPQTRATLVHAYPVRTGSQSS